MGLFRNTQDQPMARMVEQHQEMNSVQEIDMVLEYFDKSQETISIAYNLEELQKMVSTSFGTGSSMNFTTATPPFFLNPRWIKKITYQIK